MASRKLIMGALFTLLSGSATFKTASRRLVNPEGMDPAITPALFVVAHADPYKRDVIAAPPKREITAMAIIYYDTGNDQNAIPEDFIDDTLDAIDGLLKGDNPLIKKNTLGGLVEACFIEGTVTRASGDVTGKAQAIIPIRIILP